MTWVSNVLYFILSSWSWQTQQPASNNMRAIYQRSIFHKLELTTSNARMQHVKWKCVAHVAPLCPHVLIILIQLCVLRFSDEQCYAFLITFKAALNIFVFECLVDTKLLVALNFICLNLKLDIFGIYFK